MSDTAWNFAGRRVLVTGAATGIGLAITGAFVRAGAQVVAVDRDGDALEKAISMFSGTDPGSASAIVCDLADAGAIVSAAQEAKSRLGGIDVLVNNAGIGRGIPLVESSDEYIDQVLAVNLRAVMLLTREVLRFMLEQGDGSVINIASQAAKRGYPDISHYSASKAGVLGFTIALAVEVAPTVRVNAVCPGMVETAMMKNNIEQTSQELQISYQAAYDQWRAPIPLRRLQQPEDVANGVLFLASAEASEITGEALNVSGGLVMW